MDDTDFIILAVEAPDDQVGEIPLLARFADGKPAACHSIITALSLAPSQIVVASRGKNGLDKVLSQFVEEREATNIPIRLCGQDRPAASLLDLLKAAVACLSPSQGTVVLFPANLPLVTPKTVTTLLDLHDRQKAALSVLALTASLPIPKFTLCAIDRLFLESALTQLEVSADSVFEQLVSFAGKNNKTLKTLPPADARELSALEDLYSLSCINAAFNQRRVEAAARSGVVITDPASTFIGPEVGVAAGATLGPCCQLFGRTIIESGVKIEGNCLLKDVIVRKDASLKIGVRAEKSEIGIGASVGPFAHLREGSVLGEASRIGNFVETKKTRLGHGAKASHLTYLGDCEVGESTNIGAGTITCNYDGQAKHHTQIGKNVFVGSNSALVAPLTVEDGATIGAGSVITKTVEQDSLALTRAPQVSIPGWSKRKRASRTEGGKH